MKNLSSKLLLATAVLALAACGGSKPLASFRVDGPGTAVSGGQVTFTVTAIQTDGNVKTDYLGTIHVTSDDAQAVLPADYTFQKADLGIDKNVQVTFASAGAHPKPPPAATPLIAPPTRALTTVLVARSIRLTPPRDAAHIDPSP